MPIYLNGEKIDIFDNVKFSDFAPRQIVSELDRYVVGQTATKRAVSIALRNRIRRQKLPANIARVVLLKNIFDWLDRCS